MFSVVLVLLQLCVCKYIDFDNFISLYLVFWHVWLFVIYWLCFLLLCFWSVMMLTDQYNTTYQCFSTKYMHVYLIIQTGICNNIFSLPKLYVHIFVTSRQSKPPSRAQTTLTGKESVPFDLSRGLGCGSAWSAVGWWYGDVGGWNERTKTDNSYVSCLPRWPDPHTLISITLAQSVFRLGHVQDGCTRANPATAAQDVCPNAYNTQWTHEANALCVQMR